MMLDTLHEIDSFNYSASGNQQEKTSDNNASIVENIRRRGAPWVDLSSKKLTAFPSSLQTIAGIQYLNINSNSITNLPDNFFESFPHISWLDIRFNDLSVLPTKGLSSHNKLQTLLLQGNKFTTLPLELGLVKPLRDVQFSNNPLEFPPADVLTQGTSIIKDFLSAVLLTTGGKNVPTIIDDDLSSYEDPDGRKLRTNSTGKTFKSTSSDDQMGSHTRKKFSSSVVTIEEAPRRKPNANFIEPGTKGNQGSVLSTELPSADLLHVRAKEQSAREARKKKLTKIDKILQRRKDASSLDEFRQETKEMQYKKDLEKRYNGGKLNYQEPARSAPFGVSETEMAMKSDADRRKPSPPSQRPRALSPETIEKMEKLQVDKDVELTVLIKDHMTRVVSRTRHRGRETGNDPAVTAQEELSMAKRELEIAQRLQQEVSRRRKEMEFRMNVIQQKIAAKVTEQTIVAKHQSVPWQGHVGSQ